MRALLVTLVLALVIAVVGGASRLSAQGAGAPVRTAVGPPTLGICTPAWGTPAVCI